jgi:membrane-bound ClpP family serine protease
MSIGLGIFLIVIGAIFAFALQVQVDWIDLQLVGYICLIAGVIVTILGIVLLVRRRQSLTTSRTSVDPATGERVDATRSETDPLP